MKRIDDKIKEIEKKDKTNRILYIAFVILIAAFMAYALQAEKTKSKQQKTIVGQDETIQEQLDKVNQLNTNLNDTITLLRQSQTPAAFWNATTDAGITISYLDYITHKGKPETQAEYIEIALANIKKNSTAGKKGWLYCGKMEDGQFKFDDNFAKIIWRANENNLSNLKPQKEDILQNASLNRYTYYNKKCTIQNGGELAWNKGAKVFVTDVREDGNAIYLKLKF